MENKFTTDSLAAELGVSIDEIVNAIEIVGADKDRIEEFIKRNHTETDDTNEQ